MTFWCWDDNCIDVEIDADTVEAAAQAYFEGGDWDEVVETAWMDVHVSRVPRNEADLDDVVCFSFTVDPEEPACINEEHDFQSRLKIVGGCDQNPGVWAHGGGVIITEVCDHCGLARVTDTWAQNPATGEQGLRSVRYTSDFQEKWRIWKSKAGS